MLKYKTTRVVDLSVWDNLVEETYGRPYRLQQQDGCKDRGVEHFYVSADSGHIYDFENDELSEDDPMGVSFTAWLAAKPTDHQKLDWHRHFYPSFDVLIQDMFERGLIEPGEYTIEIDW